MLVMIIHTSCSISFSIMYITIVYPRYSLARLEAAALGHRVYYLSFIGIISYIYIYIYIYIYNLSLVIFRLLFIA